jgi:Mn-containing catalase
MYHHVKKLMYDVTVDVPDIRFGNLLLEQFGGANGELAAAMQYTIQGWNCDDPERKDLLMDIGTEEISHLEVVGALIRMHLNPQKKTLDQAEMDPLLAVTGGGGINIYNSNGNPWTADYLKISGELDVDLRNNIAAEARAKITYERLMHLTDDRGTLDALQFLMTREITHLKAFSAALDSLGQDRFQIGMLPPTPGIVDEYYNDSTGSGALGTDGVGSWINLYGLKIADTPEIFKSIAQSESANAQLAQKAPVVKMQAQIPAKDKPSIHGNPAIAPAEANGSASAKGMTPLNVKEPVFSK